MIVSALMRGRRIPLNLSKHHLRTVTEKNDVVNTPTVLMLYIVRDNNDMLTCSIEW